MEHPTHCIGSACVLPDGCRFLRKHSEIIAQKWRAEPLLRQPTPSRSRKSKRKGKAHQAGGGGVRQGAVWNSLRHETGRCLGLAASRSRALPETRYAAERGARSTATNAGYSAAASIGGALGGAAGGRCWRVLGGARRVTGISEALGWSSLRKGQVHQRMARFVRHA